MRYAHRLLRDIRRVRCLTQPVISLIVCGWLALLQPGMSDYWLINPQVHAAIDAEAYSQLPDGRPLPGYPARPPHSHPGNDGLTYASEVLIVGLGMPSFDEVFVEADRPSLQGSRSEVAVIVAAVFLDPPEHPPRA